jgi:Saxitoxin biosynthesis operon protein SxtJ
MSQTIPHALPSLPSNRRFGALFALVFSALAAYGWYKGWARATSVALLVAAAAFTAATVLAPALLAPLNKAWFKLGLLLGRIVSPIVLGAIYFLLITPVAIIGRFIGRDELKLRKRTTESYWIDRVPLGPAADSFKNMF